MSKSFILNKLKCQKGQINHNVGMHKSVFLYFNRDTWTSALWMSHWMVLPQVINYRTSYCPIWLYGGASTGKCSTKLEINLVYLCRRGPKCPRIESSMRKYFTRELLVFYHHANEVAWRFDTRLSVDGAGGLPSHNTIAAGRLPL